MRWHNYIFAVLFFILSGTVFSQSNWHDSERDFRTIVKLSSDSKSFQDKPVLLNLNFTTLMNSQGGSGSFDLNSFAVYEVDINNNLIDPSVSFQFDPDVDFNSQTKASGELIILTEGNTPQANDRYYHIYYNETGKSYTPKNILPQINLTTIADYKGQETFKIQTSNAEYYYHKIGGGFAGMVDINGRDWIQWEPSPVNKSYRGIPNMGDAGHPGYSNGFPSASNKGVNSTVIKSGPIRYSIHSITDDGTWEWIWDFFPNYSVMTLLKKPANKNYWFQYEGVPGGTWQPTTDKYVRSNGTEITIGTNATASELSPEWAYFTDTDLTRSLFVTNNSDNSINDFYARLSSLVPITTEKRSAEDMTVFAFGRAPSYSSVWNNWALLNAINVKYTIGFSESKTNSVVASDINSSMNEMSYEIISEIIPTNQIVNFSYIVQNSTLLLSWQTLNEINNLGFDVERSSNNLNWLKIGFVPDNNNQNSSNSYQFTDIYSSGTTYYRIKQIGNDNSFNYSNVLEVVNNQPQPVVLGPQPGEVYKEFYLNNNSDKSWRVTDPNINTVRNPAGANYLPNPILNLSIDDLQSAVRAEIVIDHWGGHIGTTDKRIRFNNNNWITIPELTTTPAEGYRYIQQYNPVISVPLSNLVQGANTLEATSGGQAVYGWEWGQWGWYGAIVRIYYDPSTKSHTTGTISSHSFGQTFDENPNLSVSLNGSADRVDYIAYYDGYDQDGDGVYKDWQQSYQRFSFSNPIDIRGHAGTSTSAPFSVTWNTSQVPDQLQGDIKLIARIKGTNGIWYVTQPVENLTLQRNGYSIKLYKPSNVPQNYWVPYGAGSSKTKSNTISIPADHNLSQIESSQIIVRTWNGIDKGTFNTSTLFNNNEILPAVYGKDHFYSLDVVDLDKGLLNNGSNTISFRSNVIDHHGIEVLWPGPALLVKYNNEILPPSITQHPESQTVNSGNPVTFSVSALSNETLTYKWMRNGQEIFGANLSSYTINSAADNDNGVTFTVDVSNQYGSVLSNPAVLTVINPNVRVTEGLQVFYDFKEGSGNSVTDKSNVGSPYNLSISNPAAVTWGAEGLTINSATIVSGSSSASKIINAVKSSNEISIEAWVRTSSLSQNGPARIVTLSSSTTLRNFTLGQGVYNSNSAQYEVRFRTTSTDNNGTPALSSGANTMTSDVQHVVYTKDKNGSAKIYINGTLINSRTVAGNTSNWADSYILALGNEFNADRNWKGSYHLLAIFNKALTDAEVLNNYQIGFSSSNGEPPAITQNPVNQTINTGDSVTFSVTASGTGNLIYQWYENNVAINGANSSSYTKTNVNASNNSSGYYVNVSNEYGNVNSSEAILTVVTPIASPNINIWYGDTQRFGHLGNPQQWINILGNVSDTSGIKSLTYSLNNGSNKILKMGPDTRRLAALGDFNADISKDSLVDGANIVRIRAVNNYDIETVREVTVNYTKDVLWSKSYSVNWDGSANVTDHAQPVDGKWVVDAGALRNVDVAYDRTIALGDIEWKEYEVSALIRVNSVSPLYSYPSYGAGIGFLLRWTGHSNNGITGFQPLSGVEPFGMLGWYSWVNQYGQKRYQLMNDKFQVLQSTQVSTPFDTGVWYTFKMRVENNNNGGGDYKFKSWKVGEAEPDWMLSGSSSMTNGSILLVAHHVDVSIDDIQVTPLDVNTPPVADFIFNFDQSVLRKVNFDASASVDPDGNIIEYIWQFNDGLLDTGMIISRTFTNKGNYSVTLNVKDDSGAVSTILKPIDIDNISPVASFTTTPDPNDYLKYYFNAKASSDVDGNISNFDWQFGDSSVTGPDSLEFSFASEGTYNVMLIVTDNENAPDTLTTTLNISDPNINPKSDDFNIASLNESVWTFINPTGLGSQSISGYNSGDSKLLISVPAGVSHDVWSGGNFAPRIMQNVENKDFEIEVKYDSPLTSRYQMQGIIIESSPGNFIRYDFFTDGSSTRLFAARFSNNTPTVIRNISVSTINVAPLYLRVNRTGNTWSLSYALANGIFNNFTSFQHTINVTSMGVFGANHGIPASSSPAFTSIVDYFFNRAVTNNDDNGILASIFGGGGSILSSQIQFFVINQNYIDDDGSELEKITGLEKELGYQVKKSESNIKNDFILDEIIKEKTKNIKADYASGFVFENSDSKTYVNVISISDNKNELNDYRINIEQNKGSLSLTKIIELFDISNEKVEILQSAQGSEISYNYNDEENFISFDVSNTEILKKSYSLLIRDEFKIISIPVTFENVEQNNELNELNMPLGYSLEQNYPNPFNPETNIRFSVPENSFVSIKLYDMLGQLVVDIFEGDVEAGIYDEKLNLGSEFSSGVYFYIIDAISNVSGEKFTSTKKMLFMK